MMPFVYKISPSGHHIRVVGTGRITTTNCISILGEVLSDPRCLPHSTALIDLSGAAYVHKDKMEVIKIAKAMEAGKALLKNRIAIVAKHAELFPAEILSLYLREMSDIRIRVFTDIDAGEAFCKENSRRKVPAGAA